MNRSTAIRMCDLFAPTRLRRLLEKTVGERNRVFAALYEDNQPLSADEIYSDCQRHAERLRPFVQDTTDLLHQARADGKRLLFEGAQSSLLDVDHGTYPFVTSSNCCAGGVATGSGLPASAVQTFIGVTKAYATRVGAGPFPSELTNSTGDRIREQGQEYGTTTGRPRRCGWFDAVAARYASRISGITHVGIMHLDTLGGFEQVGICTAYRLDGQTIQTLPADAEQLARAEPVLEMLPGWPPNPARVDRYADLHDNLRRYLDRIEGLLGVPIAVVGIGRERRETLWRLD
jgi:adenylosuccinate synthase